MSNISTSQMLSIGVVLLPLVVGAQVPPIPSPLERLQQVTAVTSLDDPAVKPWHLKLALQFFDHKGTPAGVGTIEEWRAEAVQDHLRHTRLQGDRSQNRDRRPAHQRNVLCAASARIAS
jgi:hypothetical protein